MELILGFRKDKFLGINYDNDLLNAWYEKEKGKIPKGYNLIFADGNRQNFDLDNLILISNSELFIMNQKGLYKQDKKLTKAGATIAKILDKVNKRKKG